MWRVYPLYVICGHRKVPNYRQFLKNASNKSLLVEFLCIYLTLTAPRLLTADQSITLAGSFKDGQLVKVVKYAGIQEKPELYSTHEEADTRLLLHAIDLTKSHRRIVVRCDDTDVLVLLTYCCSKVMFCNCEVYMHAGHCNKVTNRQRFIPINNITSKIGNETSLCLPAAYTYTEWLRQHFIIL